MGGRSSTAINRAGLAADHRGPRSIVVGRVGRSFDKVDVSIVDSLSPLSRLGAKSIDLLKVWLLGVASTDWRSVIACCHKPKFSGRRPCDGLGSCGIWRWLVSRNLVGTGMPEIDGSLVS